MVKHASGRKVSYCHGVDLLADYGRAPTRHGAELSVASRSATIRHMPALNRSKMLAESALQSKFA